MLNMSIIIFQINTDKDKHKRSVEDGEDVTTKIAKTVSNYYLITFSLKNDLFAQQLAKTTRSLYHIILVELMILLVQLKTCIAMIQYH